VRDLPAYMLQGDPTPVQDLRHHTGRGE
jgi:hypothetical protein